MKASLEWIIRRKMSRGRSSSLREILSSGQKLEKSWLVMASDKVFSSQGCHACHLDAHQRPFCARPVLLQLAVEELSVPPQAKVRMLSRTPVVSFSE